MTDRIRLRGNMPWTEQTTDGLVLAVIIVVGLLIVREFYELQIQLRREPADPEEAEEAMTDRIQIIGTRSSRSAAATRFDSLTAARANSSIGKTFPAVVSGQTRPTAFRRSRTPRLSRGPKEIAPVESLSGRCPSV